MGPPRSSLATIIDQALTLTRPFVGILIGVALAYFVYGVAQFVLSAGNEEKRTEGKRSMIWGIVALFCMVALWGLVQIFVSTFGLGDTSVDPGVLHNLGW